MYRKHKKIYYTGGLISLIVVPFLFYFSINEEKQKADRLSIIQVDSYELNPGDYAFPIIDTFYTFNASIDLNEGQLTRFRSFIDSVKQIKPKYHYWLVVNIPDQATYNVAIAYINILLPYNYTIKIKDRKIYSRVDDDKYLEETIIRYHKMNLDIQRWKHENPIIVGLKKDLRVFTSMSQRENIYGVILITYWITMLVISLRENYKETAPPAGR